MSDEKIIAGFETGLGIGNDFFAQQQYMTMEDLMPVFRELNEKCDGIIKESGIYAIRVQIVKLKKE